MGIDNKNTVLIVDDEKMNIFTLTQILSPEYTIYTAKNGQDAIEIANNYLPDVILLDIIMPIMDGYEVIKSLKSSEKTKEIPVVFITGLSNAKSEEKGLALGASDYISKPFSPSIVKLRIHNQIQMLNHFKLIKDLSMTDTLTGLPNRRSFNERLNLEWEHARRDKTTLSIFVFDIERFKNYNDTYGHLQGDNALKAVAHTIMRTINRSIDFIARWGGEEFIVLLPATDLSGALGTAESIRKNVEDTPITCDDGTVTKATVSIGVNSLMSIKGSTVNDFINNADHALYAAKQAGRNRVCKFDEAG